MTSWLDLEVSLTTSLAHLLAVAAGTHPADLDAALHARSAVLDLAAQVHEDLSGLHPTRARPMPPERASAHPVAHLGDQLHRRERIPAGTSLTEVLSTSPRNDVGQLWLDVARDAVLAGHEWSRVDPAARRLPESGWTAMHLLAQQVGAVTWLDDDLGNTARAADRSTQATALTRGASSPLRRSAADVAALAASGPLAPVPDLQPAPGHRALRIHHEQQLPAALARLARLVRDAEHLRPDTVQLALRTLGDAAGHTAQVMEEARRANPSPPGGALSPHTRGDGDLGDLVRGLVEHYRLLHSAGRAPSRTTSILDSDPAVIVHIRLLRSFLVERRGQTVPRGWGLTPGRSISAVTQTAIASTAATHALQDVAVRSLSEGAWLVPVPWRDVAGRIWTPASPAHAEPSAEDTPVLLRNITHAASQAAALRGSVVRLGSEQWLASETPMNLAQICEYRLTHPGNLLEAALQEAQRRAAPGLSRPQTPGQPHRP